MTRILALAVAVAALALTNSSSAQAQCNTSGYQFGIGLGQAGFNGINGFGLGQGIGYYGIRSQRSESLPYFAKFPPVYYSGIVRRPVGISPYAAPAGITPVEMTMPAPATVKNKHFNSTIAPVSESIKSQESKSDDMLKNKSAWVSNPFMGALASH